MAIVTRASHEASLAEIARGVHDPREGILGPRSVAWRLGGEIPIFIGGGRAALMQLAHPMVAYAVDHHSHTRADVVGRFQRTFHAVFAMVFGELDDALAAARRVHAVHSRIHGTIPEDIGRWPAGSRYDANDADALRWVHATLVDTTLVTRERLDGPLPRADKDAYVTEMNRFAALFGIPRELQPRDWAEHAAYVELMLASGKLAVAPCAREMAAFLLGRGAGATQTPLGRVTEAVTASLLPWRLADDFGLHRAELGVRAAFAVLPRVWRRLPAPWLMIPARSAALRRLAGKPPSRIAAWTERELFGLSRRVTGG